MNNKEIRLRIYEALLKLPRYKSIEDVSVDVGTIFSDIARVDAPEHIMENYYKLQAIKSTRPLTEHENIELNLTSKYIKPYYKSDKPISPTQEKIDAFLDNNLNEEEKLRKIYFDFYNKMEEPERSEAKENWSYSFAVNNYPPTHLSLAIMTGFPFEHKGRYWGNIHLKYINHL